MNDYDTLTMPIVIDKRFHTADNLEDLKRYSIIGAFHPSRSVHDELTRRLGTLKISEAMHST